MKKLFRGFFNHKPIIIGLGLLLTLSFAANAQNTSYNQDNIPIGGTNSSAFGFQSLASNTGNGNSAVGFQSLFSNTGGHFNAAFGYKALFSNTLGSSNSAFGYHALFTNSSGGYNVGIGYSALSDMTFGLFNTAIGAGSLSGNISGWHNTANGASSLGYNTTGWYNTANGSNTLISNTTGTYNTALGYGADVGSGALTNATAIGFGAIVKYSNTMQLGNSELTAVYVGTGNTATLVTGGLQVTGGSLAVGNVLTSDAFGVATWQPAGGGWLLTGNAGTIDGTHFIGTTDNKPFNIRVNNQKAGRIDPSLNNTFYGLTAGQNNTGGIDNIAIGYSALLNNTGGNENTAVGVLALNANNNGSLNTAIGFASLYNNTNGLSNCAFGVNALSQNQGDDNVGVGASAFAGNITGNKNTALGTSTTATSTSFNNSTVIGYGAIANASDKVVIGNTAPGMVIGGYAPWSNYSDGRFKENVKEDVPGLKFITKLRPVTYTINNKKLDEHLMQNMPDSIKVKRMQSPEVYFKAASIRQTGFIAQEVEKTANETGYDFDGVNAPKNPTDNYSLAYSQFVVPLVKSVQELSKQNEDLKKEIEELRSMIVNISNENKEGSIKISGSNSDAKLFQNAPNPFTKSTVIKYSISSDAAKARITVTSLDGIKVSEFNLINNKGQGIEITGGSLSVGTYIYTLFVDDKLIDSKKMILTRN